MSKATDFVYAILPRSIREQLLRGKISQGAVNNSFIYDDNGILKRLNAEKYSASGQDTFIYHMVFDARNSGFFLISVQMILLKSIILICLKSVDGKGLPLNRLPVWRKNGKKFGRQNVLILR